MLYILCDKCIHIIIKESKQNKTTKKKKICKQTSLKHTEYSRNLLDSLMHGPKPTLADFLPKRNREGAGVSAVWGIMSRLFGFCRDPHIWLGDHGILRVCDDFPCPHHSPIHSVKQFLAIKISPQFNGLWGEAFHAIVKSHLYLFPSTI